MIYVVKYLDGTSEVVNRNDFNSVDIDKVEKVYTANYEVRIVSELVPLGEENSKLNETVSTFKEKYNGNVVTKDGMVAFEEWFNSSTNGECAVIPEKILVPQKTYKVVKVKDIPSLAPKKGLQEIVKTDEKEKEPLPETKKPATKKQTKTTVNDEQPSLFQQDEKKPQPETKKRGGTKQKKK